MKKNFTYFIVGWVIVILFTHCSGGNKEYTFSKGKIFGTYYSITYLHPKGNDLQHEIDNKLKEFDASLSTFNPNSIISRINRNDSSVTTDNYFDAMYNMARMVSEKSNGAFDITVAPLVNAWGFGYGNHNQSIMPDIDTIMPYIGYKKIRLQNHRLIKEDKLIRLDASAIAKGQSCDVIGKLLEENGCKNYMVEIGGEIMCKGVNPKGEKWHIGIDKPTDDPSNEEEKLQIIVALTNAGLATSGNYRQFYFNNGKKYAHTIEPRTGYPVQHSLLSATVIAPTCMQADAYATAFMALGIDSALLVCKSVQDMDCYLIYEGKNGELLTAHTDGFVKYLTGK